LSSPLRSSPRTLPPLLSSPLLSPPLLSSPFLSSPQSPSGAVEETRFWEEEKEKKLCFFLLTACSYFLEHARAVKFCKGLVHPSLPERACVCPHATQKHTHTHTHTHTERERERERDTHTH